MTCRETHVSRSVTTLTLLHIISHRKSTSCSCVHPMVAYSQVYFILHLVCTLFECSWLLAILIYDYTASLLVFDVGKGSRACCNTASRIFLRDTHCWKPLNKSWFNAMLFYQHDINIVSILCAPGFLCLCSYDLFSQACIKRCVIALT